MERSKLQTAVPPIGVVKEIGQQVMAYDYSFLVISLIALVAGFTLFAPRFLSPTNFLNILSQSSIIGITAVGMTFVIVSAGIDISVGSVAAFVGVVVAKLLVAGVPTGVSVLLAVGVGALIGLINGLSIARMGLSAFIVTLAMLAIARGGAFAITQAHPVSYFPESFQFLGVGRLGPAQFAVAVLVLTFILGYYLLSMTTFGRAVYAVGGNPEAARLSGIRVERVRIWCFVICSSLAALAGIILTARLNTAWATAAPGLEFQAITAVVIGGASLFGGKGNLIGTFLGVLVIGLLNNGLSILNVNAFQIQLVNGILIFVVVLVDRLRVGVRGQDVV